MEGMGGQRLTNAGRKLGRLKEESSTRPSLGQFQYEYLPELTVGRERLQWGDRERDRYVAVYRQPMKRVAGGRAGRGRGTREVGRSGSRATEGNMISTNRVYDPPDPSDGFRVLVDRLWPRGVAKEKARVHV